MNEELSRRLDLLRFPLTACVVFIHSQAGTIRFSDGPPVNHPGLAAAILQGTFSEMLRGAAVPLFFLLSGFLFFQDFQPTAACYGSKIKRRLSSLAVPFFFWNGLVLLFLFFAYRVPLLSPFLTGGSWALPGNSVPAWINALVGLDRMPILYPFWFLRDLMILVLISPLVWYLAARHPLPGLAIVLLSWVFQCATPFPVLHHHAPLFFFYIGCLWALRGPNPLDINRFSRVLPFFFLGVLLLSVLLKVTDAPAAVRLWFEKTSAFITILTFWSAITLVRGPFLQFLSFLSGFSFFVYATHEPTLIVFTKILFRLYPPSNDVLFLVYYLGLPVLTVTVTLLAGMLMRKKMGLSYRIVTGGRGERERSIPPSRLQAAS